MKRSSFGVSESTVTITGDRNKKLHFEHDVSKTDEPILLQIGISGPLGKGMKYSILGEEVKDQGQTTPTLDLGSWRRQYSRPIRSSRFSSYSIL